MQHHHATIQPRASQRAPFARLSSRGRPKWTVEFVKNSGPVVLGRSEKATIVLEDQQVSMKHLTLEQSINDQGMRIVTLIESSTNGTVVGDVRLEKGDRHVMQHGDEIVLPCQDEASRLDYTFVYEVLVSDDSEVAETIVATTLLQQCDELTLQAARLGASIYANNDRIANLLNGALAEERDPLEDIALELLGKLRWAEKTLDELEKKELAQQLNVAQLEHKLEALGIKPVASANEFL